jgi:DNA-binding winged helix-turn-helix (wHTH) protein
LPREALSLTEFTESESSLFGLAVGPPGMQLSEPLARLAAAVETNLLDGRVLCSLPPKAAVAQALRRAMRLSGPLDLSASTAAAEARLRAGHDLWVLGDGFAPGSSLRLLLAVLHALRSSVASSPVAGRLMVGLRLTSYPRASDLVLWFERWLLLPDPAPAPPPGARVPFTAAAIERVRYWGEGSADLAAELFRVGGNIAYRRQAAAVSPDHIDEAAEALLACHTWLLHADRIARDLPGPLLDLLLCFDPPAPISATGQLRPAFLDRLVVARVLRCAGPLGWGWSSRLHHTAVQRARVSAQGDEFVRFCVRDRGETRRYSEVRNLLLSSGAELTVDAVRKTVRVGAGVCRELSGDRRCFRLLDYLLRRALEGADVVTYEQIAAAVFPDVTGADRTNIHPAIAKLRREIGDDIWSRLVSSVPGVGYRIEPSAVALVYVRPIESAELDADATACHSV